MSGEFTSIFNESFSSLRDYLIPMNVLNQQISAVEGCPNYRLNLNATDMRTGETKNITDHMWGIPYPYVKPINPKFAYVHADATMLNDDIYDDWINDINDRAMPLANYAIPDHVLDELDKNEDIGCIINIVCGKIVPFYYSDVKDISFTIIPYDLYDILHSVKGALTVIENSQSSYERDDEEEDITLGNILDFRKIQKALISDENFLITYNFEMKKENLPVKWSAAVSEKSIFSMNEVNTVTKYIHDKFMKHEKVILTI